MKENYLKILLVCSVFLAAISLKAEEPVLEFAGTISDKKTGKTIQDAKVQVERDGEVILETNTKKDGTFSIRIPTDNVENGKLKVRIRKMGYHTEIVNAVPNVKNTINVQLERKKAVPIMVPKKSPTGQYIIVYNSYSQNYSINRLYNFSSIWI